MSLEIKQITATATDDSALSQAISNAQDYLLKRQTPQGHWVGLLKGDASVSAGYIPLMYFMNGYVDPKRQDKIVNDVTKEQNPDGSWGTYFNGPGDINVSIQVYFALKLAGIPDAEPFMQQARNFILAQGGLHQANVITKIWLAHFGQYNWQDIPRVPPEIIFLPKWFYFNIYEFASWSRATIMALAIVLTTQPVCAVPDFANLSELLIEPADHNQRRQKAGENLLSWKRFFLLADNFLRWWEKLPFQPGRKRALHKVEEWVVTRQEADGSWGGILLPWIYSLFGLKSLGYGLDHPVIKRGLAGFEDFIIEDDKSLVFQPAVSPVWDTAWTTIALRESGLPPDHPSLVAAAHWLIGKEISHKGDWQFKNPHTEPGGWSFEYDNNWYPDLDDSSVVPRALNYVNLPETEEKDKRQAIMRALVWVLDMQSKDGGWAAFDRDNDKIALSHIPFADFISPLDPTCADVSAHAIELLLELDIEGPPLQLGLAYLKNTQESDGAWYGRWGVNYIYGTGLALEALALAGEDPHQPTIRRAVGWLVAQQNDDGGWGETCETYIDPTLRGRGASTASQTAWALIGLIAIGETSSPAVKKGIQYLLNAQGSDGDWPEPFFTGTGFPKVFYLRYDQYRVYYPLIALARYRLAMERVEAAPL